MEKSLFRLIVGNEFILNGRVRRIFYEEGKNVVRTE